MKSKLLSGLIILANATLVSAQAVQVQQLVVQQFGVETVIVIPDRGTAFLGGVSSAATSHSSFGPRPVGARTGHSVTNSYAEVSATIHNLELLDAAILAQYEMTLPVDLQKEQQRSPLPSLLRDARFDKEVRRQKALSILRNRGR